MDVLFERCCGLDVHKETVAACAITPGPGGEPVKEVRTFGTMTGDLLDLVEWLDARRVTHVAMESTGVYWKPVYNLLEGAFETLLVNAQHVKAVPGRKTDAKDCAWLADLLRHGLLKASFIPPAEIRELRDWTRLRKQLVRERSAEVNRVQKLLETMNVKLASVASDVMGVSGRAMLTALARGETDPATLAAMAKGRMKAKRAQLEKALAGRMTPNGRLVLDEEMGHVDYLDGAVERCDRRIEALMRPFARAVELLTTIPGVGSTTAWSVVAEIGTDMSRFPSDAHLASWAGMCPGNDESAGKRRSGKTRKGNVWLRAALTEAARAAARTRGTYLSALYRRLAGRRGKNRAAIAVGHAILVMAYHLLKHGLPYRELGADFFDRRRPEQLVHKLRQRIENLGYTVTIQKSAA